MLEGLERATTHSAALVHLHHFQVLQGRQGADVLNVNARELNVE